MKKRILTAITLFGGMYCLASAADPDTIRAEEINEIVVLGVKTKQNAPFAVTNLKRAQLDQFSKTGRELPFLFAQTPGVMAWSENGLGTGTTYMRIRGASDSRINVTLDGIALNSPEDLCVFWANMNSYGSLASSVQIQRGVGTSTNGDGAFGGNIAITSKTPSLTPVAEVSASYGSYNTSNIGGLFSTGLLTDHFIIDGAYHQTNTDGYIHGTSGYSGSYYGGATYLNTDGNLMVRFKHFGNFEKTGQAWNGVTAGNDDYSLNVYDGIKTYEDMYDVGLGRYNSLYEQFELDGAGSWTINRYKMSDGTLWNKATDNFWQSHNIISLSWEIDTEWTMSASMHYTHGYGYYNEFRYNNKLKKFGLANYIDADGNTVKKSDFIRKKGLRQDAYGIVWNTNFKNKQFDVIGGASFQNFEGNHFGYLTYANPTLATIISNQPSLSNEWSAAKGEFNYYDSDAQKSDISTYIKGTYHITPSLSAFGDLQFRHVAYQTNGINDKFYTNPNGTYMNQKLDINKQYNFLNPKAGLTYNNGSHTIYGSIALSHREPERNNFTDNGSYPAPKAERVMDYELGYILQNDIYHVGINAYYMKYTDQFVQTGLVSDIGENLTTNIPDSYRMGIELQGGVNITPWLSLEANAALSRNRIKDFTEVIETYDDNWNDLPATQVHYDNSILAFSPSFIGNAFLNFHYCDFQAVCHANTVSRQYLDNTENHDRSLPAYHVLNATLSYTLKSSQLSPGFGKFREAIFGLNFNNILNRHYATNGWVYSSIVGSSHPESNRYYQIGYTPMAGFNMMGSLTLRF